MTTLKERLAAYKPYRLRGQWFGPKVCAEALARIEALEAALAQIIALLARYRAETPLGHQPHMIAHVADEALARARQALSSLGGSHGQG